MYVGSEQIVLGRWFQRKVQRKRKSECYCKLLKLGTTRGLKGEKWKEWEFNLLVSKECK